MKTGVKYHYWLLVLGCVATLSACLPEDKDPSQTAERVSKREEGVLYGATLGNTALQIQNVVVSDPTWFTNITNGQELNLANMGINTDNLPVGIRSHVCPTGNGNEILQLTWIDGQDENGQFAVKSVGLGGNGIVGSLRTRVSPEQLGTALKDNKILLSNDETATIPASCGSTRIAEGAPVLVFRINRPTPPSTTLSRIEFRSVACEETQGIKRTGVRVQRRIVTYNTDGSISPIEPDIGWLDDDMGECLNTVDVAVQKTMTTKDINTVLDGFAAISLRNILMGQIQNMGCRTSSVTAENLSRESSLGGNASHTAKDIDTCGDGLASMGQAKITETASGKDEDLKILSCNGILTGAGSNNPPFGNMQNVVVPSILTWTGTATLARDRNAQTIGADGNQINVAPWIGKIGGMNCIATDSFVANCQLINGAPVPITGDKNLIRSLQVDLGTIADNKKMSIAAPQQKYSDTWKFLGMSSDCRGSYDFDGANCIIVEAMQQNLVNTDFLNRVTAIDTRGVFGDKASIKTDWKGEPTSAGKISEGRKFFKPVIADPGKWDLTGVQCSWRTHQPTVNCPAMMAADSRQGNYLPTEMLLNDPTPETLLMVHPVTEKAVVTYSVVEDDYKLSGDGGGSWRKSLSNQKPVTDAMKKQLLDTYTELMNQGNFVRELVRPYYRWFDCDKGALFGCGGDYRVTSAFRIGPGPDVKYLKGWRTSPTDTYQVTLLNTDGIASSKLGVESPQNAARVNDNGYAEPVRCGAGRKVTAETRYNTWIEKNAYLGTKKTCGGLFNLFCSTKKVYGDKTHVDPIIITGSEVQEWRSDTGWSRVVGNYTSEPYMGAWTRYSDIPASWNVKPGTIQPPADPNGSEITVTTATYGANCSGVSTGNKTSMVKALCDGSEDCDFVADNATFGDPKVGCLKNFTMSYTCSGKSGTKTANGVENGTITASCN